MIDINIIESSCYRIHQYIRPTRLEKSIHLSAKNTKVYMKMENEQPEVKAFKVRGVLSKLTSLSAAELQKSKLVAISSGNQGVALAYCANLLHLGAPVIYVPTTTPSPKLEKMRHFGAKVVLLGNLYDETHVLAERIIEEEGSIYVDAREDEIGAAGQGSIAAEVREQLPEVENIIVPMGSGGLAIAVASYFKQRDPSVKVYAVEASNSPSLVEFLKANRWQKTFDVLTDGEPLLKSLVGGCAKLAFDHADVLEDILLVDDDEAARATAEIVKYEKAVVEPDSAVVYAAFQKYRHLFEGTNTAMVFTGGNVDNAVFGSIMQKYYDQV